MHGGGVGGGETLLSTRGGAGRWLGCRPGQDRVWGKAVWLAPDPVMFVLRHEGAMTKMAQLEPEDKQTKHGEK